MKAYKSFLFYVVLFVFLAFLLHTAIISGIRQVKTGLFGVWNKIERGEIASEIVFTGSSRCWLHFAPEVISAITGRTSYNIGLDGSTPSTQRPRVKLFMKNNKTCKLIFQEISLGHLHVQHEIYWKRQYLPYLAEPLLFDPLKELDKEMYLYKYLPLYGIVQQNQFYTEEAIGGWRHYFTGHYQDSYQRGFYPMNMEWDGKADDFIKNNKDGYRFPIEPEAIKILETLLLEMKAEGLEVILIFTPEYKGIHPYLRNREEIMAIYRNLAKKHGIPFWDYSDLPMCSDQQNFYNSEHLKGTAAKVFSGIFAQDLKAYLASGVSPQSTNLK